MGSLTLHCLSGGHVLLYSLNVLFGENLNASTLECKYSLVHRELTDHFGDKSGVTLYLHLTQRGNEGNREDVPS